MARKTAHPETPAPDAATPRRKRPVEPAEDDDAVARAARDAKLSESDTSGRQPLGLQKTREVDIRDVQRDADDDTFSEDAIGGLDPDDVAGQDNPEGTQTGRGPLNQDEQGNRQNDEADELESVEPDIDPFKSPR